MEEMAAVILTYRGLAEEEDTDANKVWVDRAGFDIVISIIIVVNTVLIGLETDLAGVSSEDRDWWWIALEALFCVIFIVEIALKVFYHTYKWIWSDIWNFITFLVAISAVVDAAILHPLGHHGILRVLSLFRVFGLVRLVRIVSRYRLLEELHLVIKGLIESARTLAWTVLLITVFLYICAVFLTKQIGQNDEVYDDYRKLSGGWDYEEYFGTVGRSMWTLLQCMTLDSWSSRIARHVISRQWYMSVFFVVFLLLSTFGMLNIVVSVIVEQMLTASKKNAKRTAVREEKARRTELESIREIFLMSDADGNGELELEEFLDAVRNPEVQWRLRQLELPPTEAAKLFSVIDGDGSRTLTIEEFINGCTKLKGTAQSKDLLAIQNRAETLAKKMDTLADSLADGEQMMQVLDEVTTRIAQRFDYAVMGSRRKIAHSVGGSKPMVPPGREGPGGDRHVPLSIGNRPVLPQFPDILR